MIILKILLWIAVAVWIGVWALAVAFFFIAVDNVFDSCGRIPSLDRLLDRFRSRCDFEERLITANTVFYLGLLWPLLIVYAVVRVGTKAFVGWLRSHA